MPSLAHSDTYPSARFAIAIQSERREPKWKQPRIVANCFFFFAFKAKQSFEFSCSKRANRQNSLCWLDWLVRLLAAHFKSNRINNEKILASKNSVHRVELTRSRLFLSQSLSSMCLFDFSKRAANEAFSCLQRTLWLTHKLPFRVAQRSTDRTASTEKECRFWEREIERDMENIPENERRAMRRETKNKTLKALNIFRHVRFLLKNFSIGFQIQARRVELTRYQNRWWGKK